jgi:hypothetical protein
MAYTLSYQMYLYEHGLSAAGPARILSSVQ